MVFFIATRATCRVPYHPVHIKITPALPQPKNINPTPGTKYPAPYRINYHSVLHSPLCPRLPHDLLPRLLPRTCVAVPKLHMNATLGRLSLGVSRHNETPKSSLPSVEH